MGAVADIAGMLVGSLSDPLTWVLLVIVAGVAVKRRSLWFALLIAAGITVLHVAMAYSWWQQAGLGHRWMVIAASILTTKVLWTLFLRQCAAACDSLSANLQPTGL